MIFCFSDNINKWNKSNMTAQNNNLSIQTHNQSAVHTNAIYCLITICQHELLKSHHKAYHYKFYTHHHTNMYEQCTAYIFIIHTDKNKTHIQTRHISKLCVLMLWQILTHVCCTPYMFSIASDYKLLCLSI